MPQLDTRKYGRTGQEVTVIGLGGGSLNKYSYAEGVSTVRHALELGVTYFDTSPLYANGVSQAIMGEALEGRSEDYVLATKIGHYSRPERFRSRDAIKTQIDENLRLLRRKSIDVLQVHESDWSWWWTDTVTQDWSSRLDPADSYDDSPVMDVLRDAKDTGICQSIGITGNDSERVGHVLGKVDVDVCLSAYNYSVFRKTVRQDILPAAQKKGVGVILGGIVQGYQRHDFSPRPQEGYKFWSLLDISPEWLASDTDWMTNELRAAAKKLYHIQTESGLTMLELVMRYMLGQQSITTLLVGAATPSEIEQSVRAAEQGPLPNDLQEVVESLGDEFLSHCGLGT